MIRRRGWGLVFCFLAGCSTNPIAGTLDWICPGHLSKTTVTPYGGVSIPQGAIAPLPSLPVIGAPTTIVPPPLPPGSQLQTPTPIGGFPPLPPAPPPSRN